jgi:hypothetical protein
VESVFFWRILKKTFNYIKSERSIHNKSNITYLLEWPIELSDSTNYCYELEIGAIAQPEEYLFSDFDDAQSSNYDRRFYGRFLGEQYLFGPVYLDAGLSVIYYDKGKWINENSYGITEIRPELNLLGAIKFIPENSLVFELGMDLKGVGLYLWDFSEMEYIKEGDGSYLFTPYLSIETIGLSNFNVQAVVKRSIDKGFINNDDYWELSVNLVRGF